MTQRTPHPEDWRPNPGPQTDFLSRTTDEVLYGGAAGGGKSEALLVDAIRYVGRGYGKNYRAGLFRRTFPELEGSLIPRSFEFYLRLGGRYNEQKKRWTFPGGEIVVFGHLEHDADVHAHQGIEYQFVGFDELTSFSESQYLYLFSRVRSSHGVPLRVRAGTNPGGVGHAWVMARWAPWLDPKSPVQARPGQVLHFVRGDLGEVVVPAGIPLAKGRTFIPAKLEDNPQLHADGKYEANLQALDPVTRERLRHGNWLVQPDTYAFRGVSYYDALPTRYRIGKGFDGAYTAKTRADRSVALVLLESDGHYYVADLRSKQCEMQDFVPEMRAIDARFPGAYNWHTSTTEKGLAGVLTHLVGVMVNAVPASTDKLSRAQGIAAKWNDGKVHVPRTAPWLADFLGVVHGFTGIGDKRDDEVDAMSSAFTSFVQLGPAARPDDMIAFQKIAPRTRF